MVEGESVPVFVYSNCDRVELFLNGSSLGSRPGGPTVGHLAWSVSFAPGTLRAECTQGGAVAAVDEVKTAGAPAAIALSVDRSSITADGNDLAYVEADVVDAKGVVVPQASNVVQFVVCGAGTLAGVDNGNAISLEPYKAYYQIQNVNSRLVASVSGGAAVNGAKLVQSPAQGMRPGNDQWLPVPNQDGTYSFYNLSSLQALDDPGASTANAIQLDQEFGNSLAAQKFQLVSRE